MEKCNSVKVYLATPYSHADKVVRIQRVAQVDAKAAELMEGGYIVFSPISHSHPISEYCGVDSQDHDFWLRQDLWILVLCDELHILCLEGWAESKGIKAEIIKAEEYGMKIVHHYYIRGRRI